MKTTTKIILGVVAFMAVAIFAFVGYISTLDPVKVFYGEDVVVEMDGKLYSPDWAGCDSIVVEVPDSVAGDRFLDIRVMPSEGSRVPGSVELPEEAKESGFIRVENRGNRLVITVDEAIADSLMMAERIAASKHGREADKAARVFDRAGVLKKGGRIYFYTDGEISSVVNPAGRVSFENGFGGDIDMVVTDEEGTHTVKINSDGVRVHTDADGGNSVEISHDGIRVKSGNDEENVEITKDGINIGSK